MTIDEAIEQYKHIADSYDSVGNTDDAMEARQLAEWLRTARGGESAARWYTDKLREAHRTERKLLNENAKLRSMRDTWQERDAKLVELVRDLVQELNAATQYDAGGGRGVVHEFADRASELGIEVDDA